MTDADAFTPPRMAERYYKPDSVHLYEAIQWNGDMTVWVPWSARISSLRMEGNPGARPDTLILGFRGGGFNPDTVRLKLGDWAVCTGIGHYAYSEDEFKTAFAPMSTLRPRPTPADEWKPIASAPKDGAVVILFARSKRATASVPIFGSWNSQDAEWQEIAFSPNYPVGVVPSHWMPRMEFPA